MTDHKKEKPREQDWIGVDELLPLSPDRDDNESDRIRAIVLNERERCIKDMCLMCRDPQEWQPATYDSDEEQWYHSTTPSAGGLREVMLCWAAPIRGRAAREGGDGE